MIRHYKVIFASALLFAAGALWVSYLLGEATPQGEQQPMWHETLDNLREFSNRRYRLSSRCEVYARQAEAEQFIELAALLRAIARADAIHADNSRQAIARMGGVYNMPTIGVGVEVGSVVENIESLIDHKREWHAQKMRSAIEHSIAEGNRYVARMLTWSDASDMTQLHLLQEHLQRVEHRADNSRGSGGSDSDSTIFVYRVCPTCGDLSGEGQRHWRSHFCPHCMTTRAAFLIFK